jgi:hypothetical protein
MSGGQPTGGPESEGPNPFPPPPPPPQPSWHPPTLEYSRPKWQTGYQPRTPVWVQFIIGLIAPYLATFGVGAMVMALDRRGDFALPAVIVALIGVIVAGVVARMYSWRGYFPGVFIGIGLGLVSGVICLVVVCGGKW